MDGTLPETLFVYGSLKRGWSNNILLSEAKFLGRAYSADRFQLVAPSFPYLFDKKDGDQVIGELYEVTPTILAMCDRLERHPDWYRRERRELFFMILQPMSRDAWVYIAPSHLLTASEKQQFRVQPNRRNGMLEWNPRSQQRSA